jgi:hypothetical protein
MQQLLTVALERAPERVPSKLEQTLQGNAPERPELTFPAWPGELDASRRALLVNHLAEAVGGHPEEGRLLLLQYAGVPHTHVVIGGSAQEYAEDAVDAAELTAVLENPTSTIAQTPSKSCLASRTSFLKLAAVD